MNTNIVLNIILNLLLLLSFSYELIDKYNRATYNVICGNKDSECLFNISTNYPLSPMIPTSAPTKAKLSNYRYIYLIFNIPKTQNQKTFYLEAYDISTRETIISNGDCYLINVEEKNQYEIRIFKELKQNSFIQFGFFGLPKDFIMQVNLQFKLSISLYFKDTALDKSNSLYKIDQPQLINYLDQYNKQLIKQKERQIECKEMIEKIWTSFGTLFDINLSQLLFPDDNFINSISFAYFPFLITISYSVGLEISPEKIFKPERNILSETKVINGKITPITNPINTYGYKLNLGNNFIKIMESYDNKIMDLIIGFGIDFENFSLTVSSGSYSDFILTFTFYVENTNKIKYEIEIKIEYISKIVLEKVKLFAKSYLENIDLTPVFEENIKTVIIFSLVTEILKHTEDLIPPILAFL